MLVNLTVFIKNNKIFQLRLPSIIVALKKVWGIFKLICKFVLIQFILAAIQYILFGSILINLWCSSFVLYLLIIFVGICFFNFFEVKTFHKIFYPLLVNFFFLSVCLLTNAYINEQVFTLVIGELPTQFSPIQTKVYIYLDFYSLTYVVLTLFIALYVVVFALKYMKHEPEQYRFYILLISFVWSMVLVLSSNNLILLLLGWELIGITSYLLISFYSTNKFTFKSANKALVYNKLSDFGFYLFLSTSVWVGADSINTDHYLWGWYSSILSQMSGPLFYLSIGGLLITSFCKSAQLIFYFWLPDSMEAPVPASALIHSATLVSAGIYLLGRFHDFFQTHIFFLYFLGFTGLFTGLLGALIAVYQTDLKRTLAYSTISHCGVLVFLLTIPNILYCLCYLIVHGIFKSLSFVLCGELILFKGSYQDWRKMGGLITQRKTLLIFMIVSLSGLAGLPFTVGFIGKDIFMTLSLGFNTYVFGFIIINVFLIGVCSLIYFFRIIYYVFYRRTLVFTFNVTKREFWVSQNFSFFSKNFKIFLTYWWYTILLISANLYLIINYFIFLLFFKYLNLIDINATLEVYTCLYTTILGSGIFGWFFIVFYLSIILFIVFSLQRNSYITLFFLVLGFVLIFLLWGYIF